MNAIAIPAKPRAHRRSTLGDSLLQTLTNSVTADVKAWVVQQYATIKALPNRLTVLQREATALAPYANLSATLSQTIATLQGQLQSLVQNYPALSAQVDSAYQAIAGGSANALTTTLDVGSTVYVAQNFLSSVDAVDSSIKSVVDQLLATGAITPSQATQLYQNSSNSSTGWGTYVMYAGAAIGLVWLLKKVL